jgi:hypothetical protein
MVKKKTSTIATQTNNDVHNDNEKEIIPGYTKKALEDIGLKIVCYRNQYYVNNRDYILTNSKLRYHEQKLNNEPIITSIDRFISSI